MKLYVIYSRGSEDGFIPPQIFAFTKDENLLDMFKSQRDMSKYVLKTFDSKDLGKETLYREMNKYGGKQLLSTYLKTKAHGQIIRTKVAVTSDEELCILRRCDNLVPNYLMNYGLLNTKTLSDENLKLLDEIHLFDVIKYLGVDDPFWDGLRDKEQWLPDPDELAVFVDIIHAEEAGHILGMEGF